VRRSEADERFQNRPRSLSRGWFGLAALALGAVLSATGAVFADASVSPLRWRRASACSLPAPG
jgi:hypothetical protein